MKKKVMFISSCGGHLTQLMQFQELFNKYDYHIVTEKLSYTKDLSKKYPVSYLMYGARNYLLKYIFKFLYNCMKSLAIFLKIKPDVIITTGAHTAVPMCYIAKLFGKKVIFMESFAKTKTPTLSGRIVYPIADVFIIQWEALKKFYPKGIYLGGGIY